MNTSKAFDLLVSNFYATSIVKGHGAHSNSTERPTKGFESYVVFDNPKTILPGMKSCCLFVP